MRKAPQSAFGDGRRNLGYAVFDIYFYRLIAVNGYGFQLLGLADRLTMAHPPGSPLFHRPISNARTAQ